MTTWTYDSTSLESTYGNVTVVNDYIDFVDRRGENIVIPYLDGVVHVQKYFGERHIAIGIAIKGTSAADFESRMDSLLTLISTRTLKVLSQTRADASVRTALAIVDTKMDTTRSGPDFARVVIDFTMPDPFFRSDTITDDNTVTVDASPHAWTVTNDGSTQERNPIIILTGPLTNPVITNTTTGAVLTYTGAIDAADTVTIQITAGEFTATHSVDGNVIGNVSHTPPSAALMTFDPVENTLAITSDVTTTGTVEARFYPPFI